MAEKQEVKKKNIWKRIYEICTAKTYAGGSLLYEQVFEFIDVCINKLKQQVKSDIEESRTSLRWMKKDLLESLSPQCPGGISEIFYKIQYAVDYWMDLVSDQARQDGREIRGGLKKIGRWAAPGEPGGLSEQAAWLMEKTDAGVDCLGDRLEADGRKLKESGNGLLHTIWEYRKKVMVYLAALVLIYICIIAGFNYINGYEYSYNGRTLGIVKEQEDVIKVLDVAARSLTEEYGVDVQIDAQEDFSFERVSIVGKTIDTADDVLRKLTYMQDTRVSGYGIYVDDKKAATLESEESAKSVLQILQDKYAKPEEGGGYIDARFKESITIHPVETTVGKLMSANKAAALLGKGESKIRYTVALGDTPDAIADAYGMSKEKFYEINPEISKQGSLQQGTVVNVINRSPKVTVVTEKYDVYKKSIAYKTKEVKTDSLYEGDKQVQTKGQKGEKRIKAKVICEDGAEVNRTVVDTAVIQEPVTKVVLVGTKKRPSTVGSGHLINPCPAGYQSSGFGSRWGGFHRGVDLACGTGNNIYAADGGTVILAGYNGSYGNCVKINHQNGMVTVYGHASRILVSVGDKVYQGQVIAKVGSTGHSTGAHCHFEVQVNGSLVNPRNYF